MKNNAELQKDVQNAIKWEPLLHAAEIGVTAKDGIVTLTGVVDSYAKKIEAENAAKKVSGVKILIEKIEVKIANEWSKNDMEIAREVLNALNSNSSITKNKVKAKVEDGWITLTGDLAWNFQSENATQAVNYLPGVKGVTNNIAIKSVTNDSIEKEEIENALKRSWSFDNAEIKVSVYGTTVTLTGIVNSWYEREEAERIAWKTPGVWHVNNELSVDYYYKFAH
jgi:osmotically-inducible protein OsmY